MEVPLSVKDGGPFAMVISKTRHRPNYRSTKYMSSTKYDGKDLVILATSGSTLERVAGSRDCTIDVNGSLTERVQQNGCRIYKGSVYGWEMSASGLYTIGNSGDLAGHLIAGTLLYVGASVAGTTWTGYGYITSIVADGSVKGKVTYQLTITGSGPLTTS